MLTIEYKGRTFEYNERVTGSYSWQKTLSSDNPKRINNAISRLFLGRDEYYAYLLALAPGDEALGYDEWSALDEDQRPLDASVEDMGELIQAVLTGSGQTAKN